MVQKVLHFIWIGKHIPNYGLDNMHAFQHANPDFTVNVVHIPNINQVCDSHIMSIYRQIKGQHGDFSSLIAYYKSIGRSDAQIMSNILRYDLLNMHGGIYIDFDCIPLKSFDDKLLRRSFVVSRKYYGIANRRDCYFIGKDVNERHIYSYNDDILSDIYDPGISKRQLLLLKMAMKNRTHINVPGDFYIAHANMEEWKKW